MKNMENCVPCTNTNEAAACCFPINIKQTVSKVSYIGTSTINIVWSLRYLCGIFFHQLLSTMTFYNYKLCTTKLWHRRCASNAAYQRFVYSTSQAIHSKSYNKPWIMFDTNVSFYFCVLFYCQRLLLWL